MKVSFLGTAHGAPEKNRACTSMLLETAGNYYVIDAGTSVEKYMRDRDLPIEKIKAIFITHMHEDHVGCLSGLIKMFTGYYGDVRASVFFPEKDAIEPFKGWLTAMHFRQMPPRLPFNTTSEGTVYEDENVKVSAFRTDHIHGFNTYGYIFEAEGKRVMFTGDLAADLHDYPLDVYNREYDAIICELTHYGANDVNIDKLSNSKTKKIIFGHVYPGNDVNMTGAADRFPFPIFVAADGNEYNI